MIIKKDSNGAWLFDGAYFALLNYIAKALQIRLYNNLTISYINSTRN